MAKFKAIVVEKADKGQTVSLTEFDEAGLMDGDVTVRVGWSTINYKDGLAITGKAPVVRRFPMIPGIDFAGEVEASSHPDWKPGDKVILNGWGTGETPSRRLCGKGARERPVAGAAAGQHEPARGDGDRHRGLYRDAGGDGARAARAQPAHGPVVVTGAAGGVGSVAIALLAKLGFQVTASTGRREEADYLKGLGATEIIDRNELSAAGKPLAKERFAGGINSVGSTTLANVLSMTKYGGAVAACGLAGGMDLPGSVAPFILRGVSLLGIDSVMCPLPVRNQAWGRLESGLDRGKLEGMTREIGLAEVIPVAGTILEGRVRGRIVVKIR